MTPPTAPHGTSEPEAAPALATTPTQGTTGSGRFWLHTLAVAAIGLLLALSAGLLLVQRNAALDLARAQAQREVQRLAAELEQYLHLAQASITSGSAASAAPGTHHPMGQTLGLPITLRLLYPASTREPEAQWQPDLAQQVNGQWVLPLRWRQPAAEGGRVYQLDLPRDALLTRFASEGLPAGGSMSLFRVEPDGATTVLVRHPLVPQEQGRTLRGHVADAVRQASAGVFQATAQIDGIPRIVGFQRLAPGADRLVVVYALAEHSVLAPWTSILPAAVLLTLLVAAAMAYGAWRLDRSMQALARSERHFQTLSDHMPDVVVRYDTNGRVLYANPSMEAATGIRVEAMLGRTFSEFGTPPEIAEPWMACLRRVFATGQAETLYFNYPGPQGERYWEAHASLEAVAAGDNPTVLVITRDITARREAEARQRTAQRLFETVFQAAPEAMSLSDWDSGRLLLVNDAFCALFGRPREQLIGQTSTSLGLWQPPSMRQQLVERLGRGEHVRDAIASSTRPDGSAINVRFSAERVEQEGERRLLLMFRDVTQLEIDQRALARSEQRFRLAASHGQVWEWDFGRGFFQPSDEFFVALGHPSPPADQMGALFMSLIHPEDLPRLRQILHAFLKGEADYRLEFRARDAHGDFHWFDTRGDGLRDASGRVIYMAGTTFDISDRKVLEETQRQAEAVAIERGAILEQVFDVIRDMLFLVDEQERFVFFKAASDDRLLRPPEEFLGQTIGDVMPPILVSEMRHLMEKAREAGPQELNYSLELPAGTHHFNARLAWLPGKTQCMFLVRDTTEQQKTREESERLNRFVLLLFRLASRFINLPVQQMDEAIDAALKDMGEFVGADRAYLFAYDLAAGTATNTHEWCAAGIAPQKHQWQGIPIGSLSDWYRMHLRGEKVQVIDRDALPDNALRDMLQTMDIRGLLTLPLMDGDACLGFVGLDAVHRPREYGSEDVTLLELFAQMLVNLRLRAQAAAQVHDMTEQLERKVDERTQQLHDSVQRLQAVNRELESFNYSASHDLRTPLRGIEGFTSLLLEDHAHQLDEQGLGYLRRIQRATLHMSQLVSDLLAYSRLQQMTERIEPVNLTECVERVLAPFGDELAARQGQVDVQVPRGLRVHATAQGLAIVLRNLIDNALKFTPAGQAPRIRIEAHTEGAQVRLRVADQGMGFDMQHHDRIFGMFQRLHRQDQIPGTGIGLALVHKAVERMGGQIRADSAPGQGARFDIQLPLA